MSAYPLRWIRRNLFANITDAVLSAVAIVLLAWLGVTTLRWAIGARWSVVGDSIQVLLVGIYPTDQIWRPWMAALLLAAVLGGTLGTAFPIRATTAKARSAIAAGAAALVVTTLWLGVGPIALAGLLAACWAAVSHWHRSAKWMGPAWLSALIVSFLVLARPGFDQWGGLMLSIMLTIVTSVATLPLGVLLAFGRRSRIPSVRICCTGYIETMRSVPLILVVYWIWISVPLLAPEHPVASLIRGMIGYSIFYCAYVAEYVRSGLQAVSRGQAEAARSLGMGGWNVNTDIVLPQAIRVVLPALVGNVLDIFNGATLVFILGLTDFLRAGQMILADPRYSGRTYEVYAFMFIVYFAIGSAITYGARRLEAHLGRGSRA